MIPGLKGQNISDRTVEVGCGLEVEARVGVGGKKECCCVADGSDGVPGGAAIGGLVKGAVCTVDSGDGNAFQGAGINIADA